MVPNTERPFIADQVVGNLPLLPKAFLLDGAAFEQILADLPLATYRAGETVLTAGSRSNRLLILKRGAVVILKDSIEIARVEEPGAVIGELSALLDQPHMADVRALEDSQFFVADAALLEKDPIAMVHVARILARRLIDADRYVVGLMKELRSITDATSIML